MWTETELQANQINILLVELGALEMELERMEQEPPEASNGNLEEQVRKLRDHNLRIKNPNTQRRRILDQLQEMLQAPGSSLPCAKFNLI